MNFSNRMISNPFVYFSSSFIVLVVIFIFINNLFLSDAYTKFIMNNGKSYFNEEINRKYELKREVRIDIAAENKDEIILTTVFYNIKNPDGTYPAKNIRINLIYEGLLPVLLVLVLTLSLPVPWKRKFISSSIAFVLMNLYVYFKLFAFAYDNYSSPDFILKDLPFVIDRIVFGYNYFISISGYSFNLVIAVIIFAISAIRAKDLETINEILQNKTN